MTRPACRCGDPAVILVPYSGNHLCTAHFTRFVERRVKREVRKQGPFPAGSVVAVGVSGGKDSVVTLHLLHRVFRDNPTVTLKAVAIDEGIAGYRAAGLEAARANADRLGVDLTVVSYREVGRSDLDVLVRARPDATPCGMCGPLRRQALNDAARRAGATHLATGHNLDDLAQTVLMNVVKGDVDRLGRLAPHGKVVDGLVPRVVPLRTVPEREVALYAHLTGIEYHDGVCPYSVDAARGRVRDMLLDMEERDPGTRHALLAVQDRVADLLQAGNGPTLGTCTECGRPSSGAVCVPCTLKEDDGEVEQVDA